MAGLASGGEVVEVHSDLPWVTRILERNVGEIGTPGHGVPTSVRLIVERPAAFPTRGMRVLTRGAYTDRGRVLLRNAGGSGFDMLFTVEEDVLEVRARYQPGRSTRVANTVLSSRFGLLASQVLVHYPVFWRSGWRGRVPMHVSVLRTDRGVPMLAGPGGVGKSTVLVGAVREGAVATADNLCCADETSCYGVVEPLRTDAVGDRGARTSHGRVSRPFGDRESALAPDRIVVIERGPETTMHRISAAEAVRTIVAGTYAAGELRRYWAMAATVALGTGVGPVHPPIEETAFAIAASLPCSRLRVGDGQTVTIDQLCDIEAEVELAEMRMR